MRTQSRNQTRTRTRLHLTGHEKALKDQDVSSVWLVARGDESNAQQKEAKTGQKPG